MEFGIAPLEVLRMRRLEKVIAANPAEAIAQVVRDARKSGSSRHKALGRKRRVGSRLKMTGQRSQAEQKRTVVLN